MSYLDSRLSSEEDWEGEKDGMQVRAAQQEPCSGRVWWVNPAAEWGSPVLPSTSALHVGMKGIFRNDGCLNYSWYWTVHHITGFS